MSVNVLARTCRRAAALLTVFVAALASSAGVAAQQEQELIHSGHAISGHIEIEGGGAPVERLEVYAQLVTGAGSKQTISDNGGLFYFDRLRAGTYAITVKVPRNGDYEEGTAEVLIAGTDRQSLVYPVTVFLKRKAPKGLVALRGYTINAKETDKNAPKEARKAYKRGVEASEHNKPDEAILRFREALAIYPTYLFALNDLGVNLFRLGRNDEAVVVLRQAVTVAPSSYPPHMNLAIAYLGGKHPQEAADEAEAASRLDPSAPEPHFVRARVFRDSGNSVEAISSYSKAFELGGFDMAIAQFEMAEVLDKDGQREAAANAYKLFLSIVSTGPQAALARERIRTLQGA